MNKFKENFNGNNEEFANRIYSDMNICDKYILDKLNIDEKIFTDIKLNLEKLSSNKIIQQWINKSLKIRKIEDNRIYFITEDMLKEYISKTIDKCEEYMQIIKL